MTAPLDSWDSLIFDWSTKTTKMKPISSSTGTLSHSFSKTISSPFFSSLLIPFPIYEIRVNILFWIKCTYELAIVISAVTWCIFKIHQHFTILIYPFDQGAVFSRESLILNLKVIIGSPTNSISVFLQFHTFDLFGKEVKLRPNLSYSHILRLEFKYKA